MARKPAPPALSPAADSAAVELPMRLPPTAELPGDALPEEGPLSLAAAQTPASVVSGHAAGTGGEAWLEGPPPPGELEFEFLPDRLPDADLTYRELFREQWLGIRSDYAEFYSFRGLVELAAGFGVGAAMANTGFDENFLRDTYAENIVLAPSGEIYEQLHEPRFFGQGQYTIPIFAAAALAEPWIEDLPLGSVTAEWGQRSLRTILVGGPPLLLGQLLTGGSRPGESSAESDWQPFHDNNGVSGHSFMGAIPFLSAAKMTDNLWLKGGLYVASTLPGVSRVNDEAHYLSQAFLGWWLAYLAASAVDRTHNPDASYRIFVYPQADGMTVGFTYTW